MDKQSLGRLKRFYDRRTKLEGRVSRNVNKTRSLIEENGSRTVLKSLKERISESWKEICEIKEHIIKVPGIVKDNVAEAEEWNEKVSENCEDIIDEIDAHLEARAEELESTLSYKCSDEDLSDITKSKEGKLSSDEESLNSEKTVDSELESTKSKELLVDAKVAEVRVKQEKIHFKEKCRLEAQEAQLRKLNARLKLKQEEEKVGRLKLKAKLLDEYQEETCVQSKRNKKADFEEIKRNRKKRSQSSSDDESDNGSQRELDDSYETEADDDAKDLDNLFKGLKKPQLTTSRGTRN
ncbi:hypothetical protein QZH41_017129 [Actinostola sp. cb2023]|nr:hypothetical protein QZH41_006791 [Actinostola sp. cb2023]KAK3734158.1 hypothetical protein QZH41_017129 [Actinostola sp. cb2023]